MEIDSEAGLYRSAALEIAKELGEARAHYQEESTTLRLELTLALAAFYAVAGGEAECSLRDVVAEYEGYFAYHDPSERWESCSLCEEWATASRR